MMMILRGAATAIGALILMTGPGWAAGYMQLPGIAGESRTAKYENWIEIDEVSYDVERAAPASTGSGRVRAQATFEDVSVLKAVDAASPYLALATARGQAFPEATIDILKPGGPGGADRLFYQLVLTNVVLTSDGATLESDGASAEALSLNFEKILFKYFVYDRNGKVSTVHETSYDVARGQ